MSTESLIDRPLTILQRCALQEVAKGGHFIVVQRLGYGRMYQQVLSPRGFSCAQQIVALRRRRFVIWINGQPEITLAGMFELFLDPDRLRDPWEGMSCACGGGWAIGHAHGCPEV